MLSIGKLAAGQHQYYLELAREDYYVGGMEPPGKWWGRGAAVLGLQGLVQKEVLANLFSGRSPDGRSALVQEQLGRRPGFDLTFSAPKSVSVVWSQADEKTREKIERAQERAVQNALTYLEEHAAFTRRGKGGTTLEKVGLIAATFEHATSRAQDPQLHTHCLILNAAHRGDGTSGTLDGRHLYRAKMAAGQVYRQTLAAGLERELGVSLARKERGLFEIEGVPRAVIVEFSKRRSAIEAELEVRGVKGARAAAAATMHTRETKYERSREELFAAWQDTGKRHGFGPEEARAFLARAKTRRLEHEGLGAVAKDLSQIARAARKVIRASAAGEESTAAEKTPWEKLSSRERNAIVFLRQPQRTMVYVAGLAPRRKELFVEATARNLRRKVPGQVPESFRPIVLTNDKAEAKRFKRKGIEAFPVRKIAAELRRVSMAERFTGRLLANLSPRAILAQVASRRIKNQPLAEVLPVLKSDISLVPKDLAARSPLLAYFRENLSLRGVASHVSLAGGVTNRPFRDFLKAIRPDARPSFAPLRKILEQLKRSDVSLIPKSLARGQFLSYVRENLSVRGVASRIWQGRLTNRPLEDFVRAAAADAHLPDLLKDFRSLERLRREILSSMHKTAFVADASNLDMKELSGLMRHGSATGSKLVFIADEHVPLKTRATLAEKAASFDLQERKRSRTLHER